MFSHPMVSVVISSGIPRLLQCLPSRQSRVHTVPIQLLLRTKVPTYFSDQSVESDYFVLGSRRRFL